MSIESALVVLAGAFAGGFVNGLTGMGTGVTALGVWLHVLGPAIAAPLVVICSAVGQAQNLPNIWHAVEKRRILPFIIPGIAGVPVGTKLLALIPIGVFKIAVGLFLVAFCSFMLIANRPFRLVWGGKAADGVIGFLSGICGGLAGLSGVLMTVWTGLRGLSRDQRRGVMQPYNFSILILALTAMGLAGILTADVGKAALVAIPGTMAGAILGFRVYRRLDDRRFDRLVLLLLLVSSLVLVFTNL